MWLVVCGYVIVSVMCVGVQCWKTSCFFDKFDNGVIFSKEVRNLIFFTLITGPRHSFGNSEEQWNLDA